MVWAGYFFGGLGRLFLWWSGSVTVIRSYMVIIIICVLGDYVDELYGYNLARPARCGTPVPQPLNVMNNVKAKNVKRFVAGEGVSEV